MCCIIIFKFDFNRYSIIIISTISFIQLIPLKYSSYSTNPLLLWHTHHFLRLNGTKTVPPDSLQWSFLIVICSQDWYCYLRKSISNSLSHTHTHTHTNTRSMLNVLIGMNVFLPRKIFVSIYKISYRSQIRKSSHLLYSWFIYIENKWQNKSEG